MADILPASTISATAHPDLVMQQPTPVNLANVPVASTLPTAPSAPPPEVASETLYIQNLNERIKLAGMQSLI